MVEGLEEPAFVVTDHEAWASVYEQLSDLIGEIGRDIAVHRLALGDHRAALEVGDQLAGHLHRDRLLVGEPAVAEPVVADQGAVDDEIGIAADRRGEVGVGAERQPEMAVILRAVISLGLRAQHLLHDLRPEVHVGDPLEDMVERPRPDHLAEREVDLERLEIVAERDQFLAARRLVDAVHDRRLPRLQRLRRGDVGGDHIILDQLVRVEPLARRDRDDPPLLVEHHPALGQIELERPALGRRSGRRTEWRSPSGGTASPTGSARTSRSAACRSTTAGSSPQSWTSADAVGEAAGLWSVGSRVMGITGVRMFVKPDEPTTIEHYIDHYDYVRDLVGMEYLGIGSDIDLDGYDDMPAEAYAQLKAGYKDSYAFRDKIDIEGIDHPKRMFDTTEALIRRGYSDAEIEGILGGNFKRVLSEIWDAPPRAQTGS